jgi:uncharacterized CHY-type Zn-finger protein
MIPIPPGKNGSYKLVKYCRSCRKRMVMNKGEASNYCKDCQKKFEKGFD